jgi:hypothetical protein
MRIRDDGKNASGLSREGRGPRSELRGRHVAATIGRGKKIPGFGERGLQAADVEQAIAAAEKHPRRNLSHRRGAAANRTPPAKTKAPRDITSLRNVPIQRIGMQKAHVGMTGIKFVAERKRRGGPKPELQAR